MANHIAIYGGMRMYRGRCPRCKSMALIDKKEKTFMCCDEPAGDDISGTKRLSTAPDKRKQPKKKTREALLEKFDHCCAYCDQRFGSFIKTRIGDIEISLVWDHIKPWAYDQDNKCGNFLPSCKRCNGMKSSRMFRSLEEVRAYLFQKWDAIRLKDGDEEKPKGASNELSEV